jgi:excisionase family DNA binding protein
MTNEKLIAKALGIGVGDVLTAKEAAELLGIRHRSVIKAISRGRLMARQVGRMWYTTAHAVEEYRKETG